MPQAIALAIAWFACLVFDNLTERFIHLVLEEFALLGNPAEQVPLAFHYPGRKTSTSIRRPGGAWGLAGA
jgi:hypothetical protein